jgi:outer membrane protein, heavy metal efflux system
MTAAILVCGCATYQPRPLAIDAGFQGTRLDDAVMRAPVSHARLPPRTINLDRALDERDVARLALILNPQLLAERKQIGVAEAQLFAAGLLPDPQLSFSLDRPYSKGLVNALAGSLGLDIPALLARPSLRRQQAHALEKVRLDLAWSEWLVINQVRTLCRRIHYLEEQVAIAGQFADAARKLYDLSAKNKRQGNARLDETTLYQVGFIDAQDRRLALQRELAAARIQLNAMLGLSPTEIVQLAAPPAPSQADGNSEQRNTDALRDRLDLQALREGYLSAEEGLHHAMLASIPLPQLSFSRARDTGAVWTRGFGLGFSLPIWNRGRGEIRIAGATRSQLAAEYAARAYQVRMDIAAATDDLAAFDRQRAALAAELPALVASESVLDTAAREGNVSLLTYTTVRASLLDKQLALSALQQAQSEGEVALQTAMGSLPQTHRETQP